MSGMYNGLQARIKEKSKNEIFSPWSAHSLNLVGCHAADVTKEGYTFFFTCPKYLCILFCIDMAVGTTFNKFEKYTKLNVCKKLMPDEMVIKIQCL
jgi:hypothetical protein